jgi:hypothetical protein
MNMMAELEDDESWFTTDDVEDVDDADENYIAGEQAMDRFARALGGKAVLPACFEIIPHYLSDQMWQRRHAALMCISAIGEGCVKLMEQELAKVVETILPHLRDPHPRVIYAACNALGQMSTDFGPKFQQLFHEKVLNGLCATMGLTDQPR